ncbi:hypothetical protein CCACVL1_19017 [Corchorus capsularis]|uniref:Uncharacterized protein n=1 Tax=Corchorus capsularis TaxID=210143 RepID=A0A1R3HJ01_COCAP|nr:hypothetical protein CCACVL1_19017 [Corchorus capsularis]
MEAALCLGYGPMPSIPSITKLHFGFNPSSISVSSSFPSCRKRQRFYTGPLLALDRSNDDPMPSANKKDGGNKIVKGAVGVSIALAATLSIIGCSCKMNYFNAIAAGPKQQFQKAPSFQQLNTPIPPRKMALKSLLDLTVSLASNDVVRRGREGRNPGPPMSGPSSTSMEHIEIDQLKEEAVSLMKRGMPDLALTKLQNEYEKHKFEPQTAYIIKMALVEIFICQGKYQEAYDIIEHEQSMSTFDVRPILYKAILATMLGKEDDGKLWRKFAKSDGPF